VGPGLVTGGQWSSRRGRGRITPCVPSSSPASAPGWWPAGRPSR
jgi:hypothetical protein